MTRIGMQAWLAAFVALVFVAGVATGLLIGPRPRPGPPAQPGQAQLVRRLVADIGLDAAQQEKVEAVFARRRERLLSFNREMRSRFETEQAELRRELAEILTPEQLRRLDEVEQQRRGRRRPPRF